jgi:hypothetical protein
LSSRIWSSTKGVTNAPVVKRSLTLRRQRSASLILLSDQGTLEEIEPLLHGIELLP